MGTSHTTVQASLIALSKLLNGEMCVLHSHTSLYACLRSHTHDTHGHGCSGTMLQWRSCIGNKQ